MVVQGSTRAEEEAARSLKALAWNWHSATSIALTKASHRANPRENRPRPCVGDSHMQADVGGMGGHLCKAMHQNYDSIFIVIVYGYIEDRGTEKKWGSVLIRRGHRFHRAMDSKTENCFYVSNTLMATPWGAAWYGCRENMQALETHSLEVEPFSVLYWPCNLGIELSNDVSACLE